MRKNIKLFLSLLIVLLLSGCTVEYNLSFVNKQLNEEILVSDNNSTDNSVEIAKRNGARVVICQERGYGAALINGTRNANGKYCIMGDSDGSYDFYNIDDFIKKLKEGYELVVGNRFKGGIEKNAMSLSHKIGVKFLSGFANLLLSNRKTIFYKNKRNFRKNESYIL